MDKSIALVHKSFLEDLKENYVAETGETYTRRTQDRMYETRERDVLDENGEPTGETEEYQHDLGWRIGGEDGTETETVNVRRGGYLRIGETENGRYTAFLISSPVADAIRSLAEPGMYIELMTFDPDDESGADPYDGEFDALPSFTAIYQHLVGNGTIDPPAGATKLERLNLVLPWMGLAEVEGGNKRQVIRQILRQIEPDWREGLADI